jgi:hypothetical protein
MTPRKEERRNAAVARNEAYAKLTLAEKIDRLPVNGAKRQRARFEKQLLAARGK